MWHPNHARVPGTKWDKPSINAIRSINDGCIAQRNSHDAQCSCPQRQVPPPRPPELPFPCIPENNVRMEAWLLDRYSASTFNTCPHRALPCVRGRQSKSTLTPLLHPRRATRPPTYPCTGNNGYMMNSSAMRHLA